MRVSFRLLIVLACACAALVVTGNVSASAVDALPVGDGPVSSLGQHIYFEVDQPIVVYSGEAYFVPWAQQNVVWDKDRYTLNGDPIEVLAIACLRYEGDLGGCKEFRIDLAEGTLVAGRRYTLAAGDRELGTFLAGETVETAQPTVVAATLTQHELLVTFSEPMAGTRCGGQEYRDGWLLDVRRYTTDDDTFARALIGETRFGGTGAIGTASDDCASVSFRMSLGIPASDYALHIEGLQDVFGNEVVPADLEFTVADEGAPRLLSAYTEWPSEWDLGPTGRVIRVTFDEPLDAPTVAKVDAYRLNGAPLPAGSRAQCRDQFCWTILVLVPDGAVHAFGDNTISAQGVRDLSDVLAAPGEGSTITFRGW